MVFDSRKNSVLGSSSGRFMVSLWFKLVMSLAAVVVVSSVFMLGILRWSLDRNMAEMLRKSDTVLADELASAAGRYLEAGGSLEEFSQQLGAVPRNSSYSQRWPERSGGQQVNPSMPMMQRRGMNLPGLLITDSSGIVLFHTLEGPRARELGRLPVGRGIPVYRSGVLQGYIFAGNMLETVLSPQQNEFLDNVRRASLLSALLGVVVALVLGSILFIHIMSPLRALLQAAGQVAAGNFSVQLDTSRRDELGLLSDGFNRMTQALAEADQWKRRLIADAAHELRTPVGLIQTRLELMLDDIYPIDKANVQSLHGTILLLSRLLHDLQDLSSAEAGTFRLQCHDLDLVGLATASVDGFLPEARAKSVRLEFLPPRNALADYSISGDEQRLTQIVNNLISNALQACDAGGTISLSLRVSDSRQWLQLDCCDDGCGIPEDQYERIFERFYRLDSSRARQSGGSGLGLAISRELARLHGGTLTAGPNPAGQGSCFRLQLPLRNQASDSEC